MSFYKFVRELDIFRQPVGVRYKQDSVYRTFCGGTLSIIAFMIILFFSSNEFMMYLKGNNFNESIIFETLDYNNEIVYSVTDTQAMVAFQLVATEYGIEQGIDIMTEYQSYLQFYFLDISKTTNGKEFSHVEAIQCLEKYNNADDVLVAQF